MATGYTRNDTTNNIANGNIINAADLDGEFDAIQAAYDVTTGHDHDGTVGGGAPIRTLGPAQDVVITTSVVRPKTDNTVDLGTSTLEFKDLYLDGTAKVDTLTVDENASVTGTLNVTGTTTLGTVNVTTIDTTNLEVTNLKAKDGTAAGSIADSTGVVTLASSVLTTADINGGTIDGVTIATSDITVGSGKTLNVSAGTLTLADNQISGDKVEGGTIDAITITTLGSTTGNITTVNSTTVDTTNIEVTNLKAKDGTSAGSIANSTGVVTLASSVLTTTDINGGTVDGAVIGGASAAAGTFTTATATTGNITTVNATTVDTTNIEVTNIKAKDGTASATVADTTGVMTVASLVATTADINGGTVDNATIATSDITVGAGKTLNVSAGTLTLADNQISGDKVEGGTINAITINTLGSTTGNITTVNATTVDTTNIEVTNIKAKDGTASATIADTTGVMTVASAVLTTADINGGTIDGTVIGGSSAAAGTFTTATATTGNITTVNATTVDTTNIEVTTLKAKDGTAAGSIADSTGVVTLASSVLTTTDINGGTIDGTTIGGSSAGAGTFTTATATTGNITTVNATTVDSTNLEVTNIKAKDGTSAGSIADSTGVVTLASSVLTTTDINGGTVDGAVIGGSSAAAITGTTITATTLSVNGDVTIPDKIVHAGDTNTAIRFPAADTVTVETAGAERLRVDSSGNVGIGTSSPAYNLQVSASTSAALSVIAAADNSAAVFFGDAASATQGRISYNNANDSFLFFTDATERMRINASGNVGIGTSSPGQRLHVQTAAFSDSVVRISTGAGTIGNFKRLEFTDNAGALVTGSITSFGSAQGSGNDNAMAFTVNAAERMRIDASGNLGLGVTPSAWGSAVKVAQVSNASIAGQSNQALFSNNAFFDGSGWKYISSSPASQYYLDINAQHQWLTAPSGTAGNAITFTQAMTLNASGNLGVGTSSPATILDVSGVSPTLTLRDSRTSATWSAGVQLGKIDFYTSDVTGIGAHSVASIEVVAGGSNTASPDGQLVFSTGLYNAAATERMRIDSSGNLLVGTTARRIDERMVVVFNGGTGSGLNLDDSLVSGDATAQRFYRNGAQVGTITTTASATAYNTSSDYRLKENVQPMQDALAVIAQLNPVTYTWKADDSDGQGFIAHELQAVVPDCVTGEKDAVDAEGNPQYQGVDTSFLVATLVKAVQELAAEVDSLKAQLNP
jgi:hypothetical protein